VKIIVCGGRGFKNQALLNTTLDALLKEHGDLEVIEGGAPGADRLAFQWAIENSQKCEEIKANWSLYGKQAGPIRNVYMLSRLPNMVVAFPGGRGTKHMTTIARKAGVPVMEVRDEDPVPF
jgi:hypothetical protein